MGDPFGGEKQQGKNRKSDLQALGFEFSLCEGLDPPLSGRFAAKATNLPNHIKIDERSQKRKHHHGDADGVLMKTARWSVDARGGGQSAEANGDAKAAYGDDGGAGAL